LSGRLASGGVAVEAGPALREHPLASAHEGRHAVGRVALVIPARNEGRLLPVVLRAIPPSVWRVILVDDASEDRTPDVMRAWSDPRARRLVSRRRLGVGGAILRGYQEALEVGASCAVVVAADAQMDLAELPAVLGPIARGEADYVQGSRFRRGVPSGPMPAARVLGNRVLSAGTSWAAGRPIADSQCGFTAANPRALRALVAAALPAGYGFPAFARLEMHRRGLRVAEVPVTAIYGTEVSEIHPLRDPPRILARILWRGMLRRIGRFMGAEPRPVRRPAPGSREGGRVALGRTIGAGLTDRAERTA
jgi:glycosyltransferase involved in cell wall biosynthesis